MKQITIFILLLTILLSACARTPPDTYAGGDTAVPLISPVPEELKYILKPEFIDLLGQSRREIRPRFRMETSEHDFAFWYSGLGAGHDGTEGNVFISYNIDGMSYDGLCDYISGEIERISMFEAGTTFEQFEKAIEHIAQFIESSVVLGRVYRVGNYSLYVEACNDHPSVIERLTVRDQPEQ